ncbi:MAG TPA: hypothetical protein VE954_12505 [Oligoflexus sp.]|uniref:hypothetical protein n=1 Tax=Oligoflexus sp. TaxID=1971216 RepID=UPI002D4C2FFF|nr:hypothetical protein [Oligoflexus sp.]HYX33929.1 hypothetical protein [Oligoflexus sp.]
MIRKSAMALSLVCWGILPQCSLKNESSDTNQTQGRRLDPSVYTMTAYVFHVTPFDEKQPVISAKWLDGVGEIIPGERFSATQLRHTLPLTDRNKTLAFDIEVNGVKASSGPLSFKDCDFISELGYNASDFRHMLLNYNFVSDTAGQVDGSSTPDPTPNPAFALASSLLERTPPGASGPHDALAVQCEQVPTQTAGKTSEIQLTMRPDQPLTIEVQGKKVVPRAVSRTGIVPAFSQTFAFDFPNETRVANASVDITIRSKSGDSPYRVSFQSCESIVQSHEKELIISQKLSLYFDDKGSLRQGSSLDCCLSNGTCLVMVAG